MFWEVVGCFEPIIDSVAGDFWIVDRDCKSEHNVLAKKKSSLLLPFLQTHWHGSSEVPHEDGDHEDGHPLSCWEEVF